MNRKYIGCLLTLMLVAGVLGWGAGGRALAAGKPLEPANLQAEALSATEIRLSWWDRSNNEDGFKIERSTAGGGYPRYYTVGANVTTFTDTGLTPGVTYWYRIIAYNASGDSSPSNVAGATLPWSTLVAPTDLRAIAVSGTQINLSWTDRSADETGFTIERRAAGGSYRQIADVGPGITFYADTGLSPGVTYTYRVRAYNSWGNSGYSGEASAVTGSISAALGAPSELLATVISHSQVILTWQDNADGETGFRIERCLAGGNFAQIADVPQNTTTHFDSGLAANKTYYYRVRCYHGGGYSDFSNITGVTLAAPLAPEKLQAEVLSATSVRLTWEDSSDSETGFKIERKTDGGSYTLIDAVGPNVITYTDTELTPDTAYTYRVQAYNSLGSSPYGAAVDTVTVFLSAPSHLLAETVSSSQVKLSWTDNTDNESGFKIERRSAGGSYKQIATVKENITSYTDKGLANRTAYYYRVRAYNAAADSAYSNQVSTTTGDVPAAPEQLTAVTVSESQVKLTWKDNSSNETGFRVERRGAGGSYTPIATLGANVTTYTNTGLTKNTTYYYRIRAYNSVGNSPYSNEAAVSSGVPAAPAKLTATAAPGNKIMLTWADNADNETGFKVERKAAGGNYKQVATVKANTTVYGDTGLAAGASYTYRIRAYNAVGNSSYTNEAKATTVAAAVEKTTIVLNIGKKAYYVNNRRGEMDAAPIISGSRTLLPIRYIAEPLGAEVEWDEVQRKVTITFAGRIIELWIDKNTARVNGKDKAIDPDNLQVKPIIIPPGRTMLPLRFVSENMGCQVDWNATSQEVTVRN